MSSKKKPPTQPVKFQQLIPPPKISVEVVETKIPIKTVEYRPSENFEKYPDIKPVTYQYKILAYRNDYIKLQEEVTKHLNDGWELVGGVSASMNVSQFESITIFAQAISKK